MSRSDPDATVVVATFDRRYLAEIAQAYLDDAGIPAAVSADDGGGIFGLPLTFSESSFATVSVMEPNADDARRVLREGGFLGDEDGAADGDA